MFKTSLQTNELQEYVARQLEIFFPDKMLHPKETLFSKSVKTALERTEYCFKHVALSAYNQDGITRFSHLHADQYTAFVWFLSNTVWKTFEDESIASKLFFLNKSLNGIMCMYDAGLPNIFLILHGSGTVLGKATYHDFFVCHHGCTVGAVYGKYPVLEKGVAMAPHAAIVGECHIGECSTIGTHALIRNKTIENNTLYYQDVETGKSMVKPVEACWAQSLFNVKISD